MARVTVEDCIEKIPNRFDLVLTAGQRARGILKGDLPTIDRDNDKNPVIALREIAAETVDLGVLGEGLIKKLQRVAIREEQEIRDDAAIAAEVDLSEMVGDYSDDEGETRACRLPALKNWSHQALKMLTCLKCRVKIRQRASATRYPFRDLPAGLG